MNKRTREIEDISKSKICNRGQTKQVNFVSSLMPSYPSVIDRLKIMTKRSARFIHSSSRNFIDTTCKVFLYRGSLKRLEMEQLALGQLHWSAANYAPFQEQALWDGLVAIYEQVRHLRL